MKDGKKIGIWQILKTLMPQIVKASPWLFWGTVIVQIFHGISWGMGIMMQQRFFDQAVLLVQGKTAFGRVFLALGGMGLVSVGTQILNGAGNFLPGVLDKIVGRCQIEAIHEKIARIDPASFEDTRKLDEINKAEKGAENSFWFICTFIIIFAFYLTYFIFVGWYLFSLKPVLCVTLGIIFLPIALGQLIRMKFFTRMEEASAPVRRENEHYEACMVSREFFRETRLLGSFQYFKKLYLETLGLLLGLKYKATMKSNLFELAMRGITVAGYIFILLMLFDALMKQEVSVGAFAAVFHSLGALYCIMEEVICRHVSNMAQEAGTVVNYIRFLDMEERDSGGQEAPGWGDIALEDVSFTYPGAEKPAVQGVSFTLKKGETLAIVGENGSGKSTLTRLLCGLYQPGSGRTVMNGVEMGNLSFQALFARTSGVFQKYQRYQMTLKENIGISHTGKPCEEETLNRVCRMAGVEGKKELFPKGYDTMLSREFEGVDLSGGQWQRVAIARGFFRSHDLIILDEPTAAIDPYEETRVYNQFAEISKEKSAVIVTHRLGSVKLADRILVMKKGRICQMGTHQELMAQEGGEYKRLYESQERWYQEAE